MPGLVIAAGGVACALEATTFEVAFMTDPIGPKALPYVVASVLVLAGVHAAILPPDRPRWWSRGAGVRSAAATGAFLAYAVALPVVGFFTSTTLVVATLSGLFGAEPKKAVAAAAALSAALWLIFVLALGLPLPIGDLWIR